ncbi:MAG: LysR substrate-binding domain-containing protein [Paracoccaceae bacterium]
MTQRPPRLPPLNALRAFHAVARHRSFRQAADELLVTPQAVSQQIKTLEDTLGVTLFHRKPRAVEPTEAAILLAHYVQAGFDEFAEGVRRVTRANARERINLNVSPFFATHYLLGRLVRFRDRMPGADLRLTTMVELPDFVRDDVDVSVQWGYGDWPGLDATRLVADPKVICCTPALAETVATPADLTRHTLLEPVLDGSFWADVLEFLGAGAPETPSRLAFHDAATMRRATVSGLGIGLLSHAYAEEEIRAGRLAAPLGDALAGMPQAKVPGFYLVLPRSHRRSRPVAAFCDWILAEDWSEPERV